MVCHDILLSAFYGVFGVIYLTSYVETANLEYTSVLPPRTFGFIFLGSAGIFFYIIPSGYYFLQDFFLAFIYYPIVLRVLRWILTVFYFVFFFYCVLIFVLEQAASINIDFLFSLTDTARKDVIRLVASCIFFLYSIFNILFTYLLLKSLDHEKFTHMTVR